MALRSRAGQAAGRADDEATRRHLEDVKARAALALSPVRVGPMAADRTGLTAHHEPARVIRGCWTED